MKWKQWLWILTVNIVNIPYLLRRLQQLRQKMLIIIITWDILGLCQGDVEECWGAVGRTEGIGGFTPVPTLVSQL